MKTKVLLIVPFIALILLVSVSYVQAATRTASVTGNWNSTATWGGSAVPVAGDIVIINSGVVVTVNVNTAAVASITINAPAANNGITISGTNTLTVTGAVTMNSPTTGTITSTIAVGTGTFNAGSITIPGSATAGRFCTVSVSTGTINCTGAVTLSGTAAQARLTFTGTGNLNIGGDWSNGGTFAASTGTVTFNGANAALIQGSSTTAFNNLVINKNAASTTVTSQTTSFTAAGSLTVTQGNLILQATNADYSVTSNLTVSANGTLTHSVNWDTYGKLLRVSGNIVIDGILTYTVRSHIQMSSPTGTITRTVRTGTNAASAFSILTLSNGGTSSTVNANGTLKINDNFWAGFNSNVAFHTNGQNVTALSALLNAGGTVYIDGGTLNITGGLDIGFSSTNGAVNFSSGTLTTDAINIGDGTHTGTLSQSGGTANINGNLLINSSCSYTCTNSPAINITGNWTDNGTFTPATSTVTFNGTGAQAINGSDATQTFGFLTVNKTAGQTVTVGGSTATLNVNSNFIETQGNFTAPATMTVTGDVTLTAGTFTSGTNLNVGGNWTNNGGTLSGGTNVTFTGATKTISGSSTTSFPALIMAAGASCTMNNSGNTANSLTLNGGATAATFTIGGAYTLGVSGAVTINGPTAGATNILAVGTGTLNAGSIAINAGTATGRNSSLTVSTGTVNCTGALSFSGTGTRTFSFSGAGVLNIGGNLGTGGTFTAGTGTVNCNGSSAQTIAGYTYYILKSNNPAGVTSLATITLTSLKVGDVTPNSIFSDGGFQITGNASGTLSVAAGSRLNIGSTTVATGTSFPTNFTAGNITLDAASTVAFQANAAQTISNTPAYGNVILNTGAAATAKTAAGALTINGSLTISANTTFAGGTSLTHTVRGNWTNNGTFSYTTGSTIVLNGTTAQTIGGSSTTGFNNLTISNISQPVSVSTNANVSGTLNMNGANTLLTPLAAVVFNIAGPAGTITGSGTVQVTRTTATADYSSQYKFTTNTLTNLTVEYTAPTGSQVVSALTYGNLKLDNTSGNNTAGGPLTVNGTLTTTAGGTLEMSGYPLSGGGGFASSNGGTIRTQSTLPEGKTWTGTVDYYGGVNQTVAGGTYLNGMTSTAGTYNAGGTITVSNGGLFDNGGSSNVAAILDMGSSYTFIKIGTGVIGNNFATIKFGGATNGIAVGSINGTVEYYGPVTGQVIGSGTYGILTLNNINGTTLGGNAEVDNTLNFNNGKITTTGSYTLTIGASGAISGNNSSKYVEGRLALICSGTGSKDFPIGKGGNYRPLTINFTTKDNANTVTAEQFEGTLPGTIPSGISLFNARYWTVTQTGATNFTYYISLDGTGFSPAYEVKMLKGDGSTNTDYAVTTSLPKYTNASAFNSFSNFGLGDKICIQPDITNPGNQDACVSYTLPAITGTNLVDPKYYDNSQANNGQVITGPITSSRTVWIFDEYNNNPACSDEESFTVAIHPLPTAVLSGSASICTGGSATLSVALTGTPNWSITWTDGTTPVTVNGINTNPYTFPVSPTVNTTYTVTSVTDGHGCTNTGSGSARVFFSPVTLAPDLIACPNAFIEIPITVTYFQGVGAITMTLNYNKNVLKFKSYDTLHAVLIDYCYADTSGVNGVLRFTGVPGSPASLDDGDTLITLKFKYSSGNTGLSWDDTYDTWCEYGSGPPEYLPFCDNPPATYYINGSVTESSLSADFSADNLFPPRNTDVQFTDLSTGSPTGWLWSFDRPSEVVYVSGSSTSQNPKVQFTGGGLYTVTLTVSNANCDKTVVKAAYIHAGTPGLWDGPTSTDWYTATNWDNHVVPTTPIDVLIPTRPADPVHFYPHVTGDLTIGTHCNSITLTGTAELYIGGVFTVSPGKTLDVKDNAAVYENGH